MTTIDTNIAKIVQQFYVAYFNRPADVAGFNFWYAALNANGGNTAQISAEFAKSAEYRDAYLGKSSIEIVDQVYTNLFGRHPDKDGLQFWALKLDQKVISVDNVVIQIVAGAQGSDATAYNNKVTGAKLFTDSLDSSELILAYGGSAAVSIAKSYISSITDDASLANTTNTGALGATIASLVAAHEAQANNPEEVVLTTGIDNFVPRSGHSYAGNDTFIGNATTAGGVTLTSFDNLDGGKGTDLLKVTSATLATLIVPATATVKNIESAELTADADFSGDVSGWTGLNKVTVGAVNGAVLTAAATTAVVLTETVSGGSITTVSGGSTVNVAITGTTTSPTTISGGAGALTFTHAGGGVGSTTLDKTTGNVTSTETGVTTGSLTISGTTGNVVASRKGEVSGAAAISITGTTGSVALTTTHSTDTTATGGAITVTGGTTINVTQATTALNKTFTNGSVSVGGSAATTSVTVNNAVNATAAADVAGAVVNSVTIQDANYTKSAAGTITSATVTGFSTLNINATALTTLNVTGGTGNIIFDNSPTAAVVGPPAVPIQPTATTLGVTINGQTAGTLDDADIYTTLNITATGANSTLSNITFGATKALTVAGTKALTLTSATGLSALQTVVVSGSAGFSADLSGGAKGGAVLTSVNTSATTGTTKVTIDGAKASFTGGAGADNVTLVMTASKQAITLGAGDDFIDVTNASSLASTVDGGAGTDTLKINSDLAQSASADTKFAGQVTGFESLVLTNAMSQTIDLAVLGNFSKVTTAGATSLTLKNLPTGGTLTLTDTGTAYILDNAAIQGVGTTDSLNLNLTSAAAKNFGSVTAAGLENYIVTTADTQTTPTNFQDTLTIGTAANAAKSIVVSGNAGLNLTAASTGLTNVDASGITAGAFDFTSGALTAAATIKGSAAGINTVNFAAATGGAVTYTGGSGNDIINSSNGKDNNLTLGAGDNTVTGAAGKHTITAGAGADTVTLTTGKNDVRLGDGTNTFTATTGDNTYVGGKDADNITVTTGNNNVTAGDGTNSFTATSGNNTYVGGAGVDTVTVGSGANTLTLGAGADIVTFTAAPTGVNSYSTITDAHKGLSIAVGDLGTESFGAKISLASTAVFLDYANAVVAQGGNASVNGHFGYFTFTQTVNGVATTDTYLVESRHDGSGVNPAFIAGTDFIVKLTGVVDLSANVGMTNTNIVVLA